MSLVLLAVLVARASGARRTVAAKPPPVFSDEVFFFTVQIGILLLGSLLHRWYKANKAAKKLAGCDSIGAYCFAEAGRGVEDKKKKIIRKKNDHCGGDRSPELTLCTKSSSRACFVDNFLTLPVHLQALILNHGGCLGLADRAGLSAASRGLHRQLNQTAEHWSWQLMAAGFKVPQSSAAAAVCGPASVFSGAACVLRDAFRLQVCGVEEFVGWQERRAACTESGGGGSLTAVSSHSELLKEGLRAVQGLLPQDPPELKAQVSSAVITLLRWYNSNDDEARDLAEKLANAVVARGNDGVFSFEQTQDTEDAFLESQELFKMLNDVQTLTDDAIMDYEASAIAAQASVPHDDHDDDEESAAREAAGCRQQQMMDIMIAPPGFTGEKNTGVARPAATLTNDQEDAMALIIGTLRDMVTENQVRKEISVSGHPEDEEAELTMLLGKQQGPPQRHAGKGKQRISNRLGGLSSARGAGR